jgi:hemerythrin-like metal-binding protein
MAAITWTETLALQQPRMDDTHREFVALLCQVETAAEGPVAALVGAFAEFVAHTEAHFAQEDRWMVTLGFDAQNCHSFQHTHVLQVLHEVQRRLVDDADVATVRLLVPELAQWFPAHAQNMDAALADTMVAAGFDPDTGAMTFPPSAAAAPVTGCGSSAASAAC